MSNRFEGDGNLANKPVYKQVPGGRDGSFEVAEMRVHFGRYKRNEQGDFEQIGGFWMPVAIYGPKAKAVADLYQKGSRVKVLGELRDFVGRDDNGNEVELLQVVADDVLPHVSRIESITFKKPREPQDGQPAGAEH
jgi:single-strand DNA-binding protein